MDAQQRPSLFRPAGRAVLHRPRRDPRFKGVYDLARQCRYDAAHAHHVTRLGLSLFDQLHEVHGLNSSRRLWLALASLLHDIGYVDGKSGHHKSSLNYITQSPLLPWTPRKRLIIGSIARYHRKSLPSTSHDHFAALERADQQDVRVLSGLLRVADGLDRGHHGSVRRVVCVADRSVIQIHCLAEREPQAEHDSAIAKSDLLAQVFNRKIEVEWRHL